MPFTIFGCTRIFGGKTTAIAAAFGLVGVLAGGSMSAALAQDAQDGPEHDHDHSHKHGHDHDHDHGDDACECPIYAGEHAPIGVMGDHTHDAGEFMVSYRLKSMRMRGNRSGTDDVTPLDIVRSEPNIFNTELGMTMQPETLRVVPTDMTMDMHMVSAMWAPNDAITLMGMGQYMVNTMDHVTFAGMPAAEMLSNDNIIGTFTTTSEGFGDTKVSALVRWFANDKVETHLGVGVSLPTGTLDKTDQVLTPMGTEATLRLPYAMQLGSGTFDPLLSYTATGGSGSIGYGMQTTTVQRVHDNDEGYRLGDEYTVSMWSSYSFAPALSGSVRGDFVSIGKVEGRDENIVAPVQTANPNLYGGERLDLALGVNWAGQTGALRGHRLAAELSTPLYENLNGPQMSRDVSMTVGWQLTF